MIYLLKSPEAKKLENGEYEFFFSLKIGYTDDENTDLKKNRRLNQYFNHHRSIEILHIIPNGTEEQEKKLHYKFKDLRWDNSDEWYFYRDEIVNYIKSVTLEELDKLPSNPVRGDQKVSIGKRDARKVLSYLFDTKNEIENYLSNLLNILGDSISFNTSLDYIKSDPNINQEKLNHFLKVKKCKETGNYTEDEILNNLVFQFFKQYEGLTTIYDKLKLLCEFDMSDQAKEVVLSQIPDSDEVKSYYTALSPEKLKALSYNSTRIKKELGILTFSPELLINSIYDNFQSGKRMSLVDIKTKLTEIYQKINYEKSPKATDIIDFFDVKECIIVQNLGGGNKKRLRGYDLLTSHEQEMRDKLKAMKN